MATKELKVKITADNKPLKAGLDDSKKQVDSFSGVVKKAGAALLGAFAARELLRGIKNTVVELGNMADRLLDLEQITGISTDRLQEYEQVARVAGVNSETLANAVQGLTQRMARGQTESSPLNLALKQLGINARTASGEMRNGADITEDAIDKLAKMENITERNVLGAMLFTGAWKDLAPVLALGADGIEAARKQAHELGLVMDKEALEAANNFRIEMETLQRQLRQVGMNIGMFVIPSLSKMFDGISKLIQPTTIGGLEKLVRLLFGGFYRIIGMKGAAGKFLDPLADAYNQQYDELTKLENKRDEINRKINELEVSRAVLAKKGTEAETAAMDLIIQKQEELRAERNGLLEQIKVLKGESEALTDAQVDGTGDVIAALGELEQKEAELAKAREDYTKAQNEAERVRHLTKITNLEAEIEAINEATRNAYVDQLTGGATVPERMQALAPTAIPTEIYQQATLQQNIYNRAIEQEAVAHEKARLAAEKHAEMMESLKMIAEDSAYSIGEAFGQMAVKGGRETQALVAQAIAQAIAALMRQIATTVPFPASLAALAGVGAFAGIMRSQIPAFADGGVAFGPTLGLMGEYANARTNPEIIAPLDKLQGMLGGGTGDVEFRIKGQELWGVLKKYENRLNQNS